MRYEEHKVCADVHTDTIACVAFNTDGELLASASLDGNLCIWAVGSGELCHQYFTGHGVLSLVWSDPSVVVCGLANGTISCMAINAEKQTLDVTGMWGHSYPVEALAIAKSRLASGAHKELFIWRWNYNTVMTYQEREVIALSDSSSRADEEVLITGIDWSGDSGNGYPSLLVVSYMHRGIRIFETQRWAEIRKINTDGLVGAASVSSDGAHIAVSNILSGFDVYALDSGKLVMSFDQDIAEASPVPVTWAHGGLAVLGGTTVGNIRMWYLSSNCRRLSLTPPEAKVLAISAHYNDTTDAFFIACGCEAEDRKFSVAIWKAEESEAEGNASDVRSEGEQSREPSDSDLEAHITAASSGTWSAPNWCVGIVVVVAGVIVGLWFVDNNHGEYAGSGL